MLELWGAVERVKTPTLVVKGAKPSIVSFVAIDEWKRRQSHVEVVVVEGQGIPCRAISP
jgi:hypothetical protein